MFTLCHGLPKPAIILCLTPLSVSLCVPLLSLLLSRIFLPPPPPPPSLSLSLPQVAPVQRISRYPLLLQTVQKYTPADHEDSAYLQRAIDHVSSVVARINEAKRAAKNTARLMELQQLVGRSIDLLGKADREILLEEVVKLKKRKKLVNMVTGDSKEARFLLFNDMVMWTNMGYRFKGWRY